MFNLCVYADGILVDMTFGTGAVKVKHMYYYYTYQNLAYYYYPTSAHTQVTPAHDPNDYICGKRNNLEFIIILTEDGKIAANGGEFSGLMRYDARISIEEKLQGLGLYRGKEANKMRLGLCSRSGDIIEPMLTPQW